jgi:hypothetical protein
MSSGKSIAEQIAERFLGRGSLYHAYSDIAGKGKWVAVLNAEWPPEDGIAVYAFMTTSVDRFKRAKIPLSAYLEIKVGDYQFCTSPTILDLTDVRRRPFAEILNATMFKYSGTLSSQHLAQADDIILDSAYVSIVNKRAILGSRYKG